jgi:hypothetical protein
MSLDPASPAALCDELEAPPTVPLVPEPALAEPTRRALDPRTRRLLEAPIALAAGGGWLALRLTGDVVYVFAALAVALVAFGAINTAAVAAGAWFSGKAAAR